ncbi:MAG TPA: hypothetical protein VIL98_06935 [Gaiellaceae bacterium]
MTKHLALVGAIVAACLTAASGGLAAPIPVGAGLGAQPHAVAVPAAVVAAHPNGQAGGLTAVPVVQPAGAGATVNAGERLSCWRAYFTYDHSPGVGAETEWINPYWCGNGSAMRGVDAGWHGQICTILVSCAGESGVGTWYGCANFCGSLGQQIDGHFALWLGVAINTTLTVIYQLYPNGNYWSYFYSS